MATRLTLMVVFVGVLASRVQSCNCEIPGFPNHSIAKKSILADVRHHQYSGHGPIVYVPVCGACQPAFNYHHPCIQTGAHLAVQQHQAAPQHHLVHLYQQPQHAAEGSFQHYAGQHHDAEGSLQHLSVQQQESGQHQAEGDSEGDEDYHHHHKKDHNVHYKFEYAVNDHKTGDIKSQREERKGDVVNGEYSLVEEDGNVRTVKYYADWKTGFHAQIHNSKPRPLG